MESGGKNTPQYKCILKNLENLTQHLALNPTAKHKLTLKYMSKGWLPLHAKPGEQDLIVQVLDRIKHKPSQYGEFVVMLQEIEGTDVIVGKLKGDN